MQIPTSGTLNGKAGTASAVSFTIMGDRKVSGVDSYEVLGQGQLGAAAAAMLTTSPVAASTQLLIASIKITNTTGSPVSGIILYINGTGAANQVVQMSLVANGSATYAKGEWKTYDSGGNILAGTGLGTASSKNLGNTVVDPGTGSLEVAMPTALVTGASKTYVNTDRGKAYQRSNSGAAMSDTLPSLAAGDNGYQIILSNTDTVLAATLTVTTPVGLFPNGTTSFIINYGRRQAITWNGTGWVFVLSGNNNLVKLPATTIAAGDFPEFVDSTGVITNRTPAQVRTDLGVGLDSLAVHNTGNESIGGIKSFTTVPNAPAPVSGTDLTNKTYVDTVAAGVSSRHLAQSAWITNVAITGLPAANDGVTLTAGQVALLTNQSTSSQNGLWVVASGAWTRPTYFATGADATGSYVMVETGTIFAGSEWFILGAGPITIDTTAQSWVEITGLFDVTVDGTLVKTGNQISRAAITGDGTVSAGSNNFVLGNIPNETTQAGDVLATAIAAPLTPATGKARLYVDSTSKNMAVKNDAGVVNHGVQTKTAVAHQFLTSIADDGTVTQAQPAAADVSGLAASATTDTTNAANIGTGTLPAGRLPAFTGDATETAGTGVTKVVAIQNISVLANTPQVGQHFDYTPTGWVGVTDEYNILSFGADQTGGGDSTLGFYNAIISCMITSRVLVTAQTTTGATFTLPVAANILASTGTMHAQTTTGLIGFTYTGGGSTSLSCTVIYGTTGGLILNGSLVGFNNSIVIGGVVDIPAGFYVTSYPIINSIPGIWFRAAGASTTHDIGAYPSGGGSWISLRGTTQGLPAFVNVPISGTSGVQGGQVLGGIRITGLNIDCSGTNGYSWCSNGILMISTSGEYMEDCFVYNAAKSAYEFTTLGAGMLGEAADSTRAMHINLRFRQLEAKSTAANTSAAIVTNPAAVTNLNALAASTVTLSGAPNGAWDAAGIAKFQAIDQLTGNVLWYLVAYTGISGSTLTGCTAVSQMPNQTNSTTLNAATPASANAKPNALMFAGSKIEPAHGAFGEGITWHGSATANACCGIFMNLIGTYFMGTGLYSANSDSQKVINPVFNRTTAGTPLGIGVELHGSTFAGASGASGSTRNQLFIGGDPGLGGMTIWGVGQLGYQQPASAITWDNYELGNGAPRPSVGVGVDLAITYNGGLVPALHDRVQSATGNAATVGGAGTAVTGILPNMYVIFPPQGPSASCSGEFDVVLTKTAAGTSLQLGLKYGTANSAADATVSTQPVAMGGTAVAESITVKIRWAMTVIGASASISAFATFEGRSLGPAAITGWFTTALLYGSANAAWTPTLFNSGLSNPGPAYLGLYVIANTGTIVTVQPGSASRIMSA